MAKSRKPRRDNLHGLAKISASPWDWKAFKACRHEVKLLIRNAEKEYYHLQTENKKSKNNSSSN